MSSSSGKSLIFLSSVQKEFTSERRVVKEFKRMEYATGQVTGQVQRLLSVCEGALSRNELQDRLSLRHRDSFNEAYLQPALAGGFIEKTIPEKPRSSKQKYRLTAKGLAWLESIAKERDAQ